MYLYLSVYFSLSRGPDHVFNEDGELFESISDLLYRRYEILLVFNLFMAIQQWRR